MNELDFVQTKTSYCGMKDEFLPVFKNGTNIAGNSTVATVYVQEGGSFHILKSLDCIYYTVEKVLENVLAHTEDYTE